MRHRGAALLLSTALTLLTTLLLPGPARAEVPGVELKLTKVPAEVEAGEDPEIVEVVVSTDNRGRCQKVRFSLVVGVEGTDPEKVRVNRVEGDDAFPTQAREEGGRTRITDNQVDPGTLCRGRTVTGRYLVSVAGGAADGKITFDAEAFSAGGTLLEKASGSSDVKGSSAAPPSEKPSEEPSGEPSEEPSEPAAALPPPPDSDSRLAAGQDSTPSLLGPGLIVGAVLVLVGVGLLLRVRLRNRSTPKRPQMPGYARY